MSRFEINKPDDIITEEVATPIVLTSESGFDNYENEWKYLQALQEEVDHQNNLNKYVSECLILSESTSNYEKFKKLSALHEADNVTIGAQKTGWFDKIINFIKKIWAKFIEKITRLMTTNNYYLDKYKDIILNKKPKIGPITFDGDPANFEVGIQNIAQNPITKINDNNIDEMPEKPAGNSPDYNTEVKNMLLKICPSLSRAYDSPSGNKAFTEWAKEYFEGKHAANKAAQLDPEQLNWTNMFNFCHDVNNLKSQLEADLNAIQANEKVFTNKMTETLNKYKNLSDTGKQEYKAAADQYQTVKNNNSSKVENTDFNDNPKVKAIRGRIDQANEDIKKLNSDTNPNNKESNAKKIEEHQRNIDQFNKELSNTIDQLKQEKQEAAKKAAQEKLQSQHESAILALDGRYYFTEDAGGVKISDAVKQNTAVANAGNDNDFTGHVTGNETKDDVNNLINKFKSKGEFSFTVSQYVISSKLSAIDFIYAQYMKLIRAHVSSYVGQQPTINDNKVQQPDTSATDHLTKEVKAQQQQQQNAQQ